MLKFQAKPQFLHAKLTALWAVSESGLGGFLHAIKIPFSGLFLGSFAIIIITYIAHTNKNQRYSAILKATLLVVLIKAMASPHSPPMAYVAVLFQGVLGAFIYGLFGLNRVTALSFGAIALLESAFQKVLTLTIIFGMGLWESIQQFFDGMQQKLNLEWIIDLPWLFLIIYGLLYVIVGVVAGNFAFKLPAIVLKNAKNLNGISIVKTQEAVNVKRKKRKRIWLIGGLLLFAVTIFLLSGMTNKALYTVLRTLGAIIFFLFIFNPLFKLLMQKWVSKKKGKNQEQLKTIMQLMPSIKGNVVSAQQLSDTEKGVWSRAKAFIINWLSLSLHMIEDEA